MHPDRQAVGTDIGPAQAAVRRLNHAWEVLSDPQLRARYDATSGIKNVDGANLDAVADPDTADEAAVPVGRGCSMVPLLVLAVVTLAIFVFTA